MTGIVLKYIAMASMLIDHIGATFFPEMIWLRCIGRLAFPIFAFFVAEGCEKTHDIKRYALRMVIFAVLSEFPFDLRQGVLWNPDSQNVLWTFLVAILAIWCIKKGREKGGFIYACCCVMGVLGGFLLARFLHTDYGGFGVLTVLLFWVCRGKSSEQAATFVGMFLIHWRDALINLLRTGWLYIPVQGLCLFALPLLWFYNGKRGECSKAMQYVCYAFYPVHLLILGILLRLLH